MKLYLDTANIKEIEEGASLGLIDGITTNPSLVVKEGRSFQETLRDICRLVDGPISAEVVETESEAYGRRGHWRRKASKSMSRCAFRPHRPCSRPRREHGASPRSSAVSTTSAQTG
jgi:hypothetical protein